MTPRHVLTALIDRLRVTVPARPGALQGSSASKIHHARLVTLATLAATLGLLLAAPAADAGTGYGFSFTFTSPEKLEGPVGVAVDDSADASKGDVYVVDQGRNAVKKFSISGETATQEWKVAMPEATLNQDMVDDYPGPDEGDVYTEGEGSHAVYQINAAGTKVVEVLKGLSPEPRSVAVDAAGDFFVILASGNVLEYNGKWEPVNAMGLPVSAAENTVAERLGLNAYERSTVVALAVSSSGEELYAASEQGTIVATLFGGSYIASTTLDPNNSKGVTIAPSGDLFVDQGREVAWYEPSGKLLRTFGAGDLSGGAYGIGASGSEVYVADSSGNLIDVFAEGPTTEVPLSEAASAVTSSSAVLHGELNPGAEAEVGWHFDYSTGTTCTGAGETPAEGPVKVKAGKVEATATGLEPNQRYTFCLVATNKFGGEPGLPQRFTTVAIPPAIEGESTSGVKATEARLEGIVNPNNDSTECYFQYGSANVTESEVGCSPGVLAGLGGQGVSAAVTGLKAGKTYKYRVVVKNRLGEEAIGPENQFKRLVAPPEKPTTEEAQEITNATAELHGVVNPANPSSVSWSFEYAAGASCTGAGASATPAQGPEEVQAHPAEVKVTGLRQGTKYTFCILAENEGKEETAGNEVSFTTTAVPQTIDSESVSGVASTSATLEAQINPLLNETTYYFEYGETTGYEDPPVPAPPGLSLGSGEGDLGVNVHLQGLAAGTTYHYRVVASSPLHPEIVGLDRTFTTQAAATAVALPDGRQWEMVTPPNKHGASFFGLGSSEGEDIQAAADGGAITYSATAPSVANPAGSRSPELEQMFSTREAPGSWGTADITTPHNEGAIAGPRLGSIDEYKLFSSDLSLGFLEPVGNTPLPPLAAGSEKTIYLREAGGAYKALVTSANVPPGTKFGGYLNEAAAHFVSASPDLSHVVVTSSVALEAGAPSRQELYEWAGGRLQLASVLPGPGGEPALGEPGLGVRGDGGSGNVRHAISNDGSRIVWGEPTRTGQAGTGTLYLRDMARGETVRVDAAQEVPEPPGEPESKYWTANGEGSRVFFTSPRRLTKDSTAGSYPQDLYVFEVTSGTGEPLAGRLTDLTVDPGGTANVLGVIGASEDGSYVYFVAGGVLGDAVHPGNNLYVEHYEEATKTWGAPTFIAALANGDEHTWSVSGSEDLDAMTSRVSPNGRYLAFMSEASLTGYDNRDANSGMPDQEVFLYDASSGRLVCASCDPTGARPLGVTEPPSTIAPLWDGHNLWQEKWVAANIPGWTPISIGTSLYQSRYLSDSGRLFFNSSDALVPSDVNGQVDVYEYEPLGVPGGEHACSPASTSGSVVYSPGADGCVGLISAGTSPQESAFLDASETGGDVFFLTTSKLSSQDYDQSYDIYDAHECTAASPCAPPAPLSRPPCTTGDACKAAPTPQPTLYGAPSSETFSGAGNVTPTPPAAGKPKAKSVKCKHGDVKRHGACVKQRPKKAVKSKKARKTNRRGR